MAAPRPTPVYFSRMLHGRGVCRLASPPLVAAVVTGSGDLVAQLLESRENIDRLRFAVGVGLGGALDGVATQRWFAFLHRSRLSIERRVALHHLVFAPMLLPAIIFGFSLSGPYRSEPWRKMTYEWWPALCAHSTLVAPVQLANAYLVPRHFQVLCANTCALGWAVVLSTLSHRPSPGVT
jgi:ABC-type spermidine/putrescine transport system permease subunit II